MKDVRFLISKIANRKSQIENPKYNSGLSLIAVMWIVTILTVLASEFLYSMQLEIRIARNWTDQISAFYAAKGGFETAIAILKEDEMEYDSLDEDWAQVVTDELNNSTYETMVMDESAKINVNTADEETLTKAIVYCVASLNEEMSEEEIAAEAQTLASAIIEGRPYRTVAEVAKADGMTSEILYGESAEGSISSEGITDEGAEEELPGILIEIATVHSVDKNISNDGQKRVNINSADGNQIQQGINPEGQEIITQQEAQAIVDYRDELGNNQPGQGGPGQGGTGQPAYGGGDQMGGDQPEQGGYESIGQLLDVPAISQETFNSIRNSITVEDGGNNDDRVNINNADEQELQSLDGIDNGIADSIIRYREQNQFDNVDAIRQVKLISLDEMRNIVDRVTISDDEVLQGKVNINTAPLEILEMLPGLDEEKAQIIAARREVAEDQISTVVTPQQSDQETGPFTSLGQLLDIDGIDENIFKNLVGHVTYRSSAFMIRSEGRSLDGKIVQTCTAVVDRSGNRISTKYWKQK